MSACGLCAHHPHEAGSEHTEACREREADAGQICTACMRRIAGDLDTITDTYASTDEPPWPGGGGDGRGQSSPLPGGTEYQSWRRAVPEVLGTWVRDWCEAGTLEARGFAGPIRKDLVGIIGWLRAHLSLAATTHPAVDEFAKEVRKLARKGQKITGEVRPRGQRMQCPTEDCGHTMRVDVSDIATLTTCPKCEATRAVATLLNIAARADAWVDEETATLATGVPGSTLRRWARGGKIRRWRGQYNLGSIREHLHERQAG